MPKHKKESSSGSDSDSGPEDRNPPSKKAKTPGKRKDKDDESEEPTWSLENNRFIKVREFKGRIMVDIREFYDAGGELKPGKKGISLSAVQWKRLVSVVDDVEEAIRDKS